MFTISFAIILKDGLISSYVLLFQRSKTKGGNVNFPSDLNVEDFLSKLHYEV